MIYHDDTHIFVISSIRNSLYNVISLSSITLVASAVALHFILHLALLIFSSFLSLLLSINTRLFRILSLYGIFIRLLSRLRLAVVVQSIFFFHIYRQRNRLVLLCFFFLFMSNYKIFLKREKSRVRPRVPATRLHYQHHWLLSVYTLALCYIKSLMRKSPGKRNRRIELLYAYEASR